MPRGHSLYQAFLGGLLKVSLRKHDLVLYAPVPDRPRLLHVFIRSSELLDFQVGFTLVGRDLRHI